jgi:type IV pilus assembly protein PilV
MYANMTSPGKAIGFSLIEVMVALVILMLGLLGLAGMMMQGQRSETESYQRVQALLLLEDMTGRINANRKVASCYAVTDDTDNGAPFLGVGTTITAPTCAAGTAKQNALAVQDLTEWSNLLQGAAEVNNGSKAGAMTNARGCISFDATTQTYLVTVAWQGTGKTSAPPAEWSCGKGNYGTATDADNERERRAVGVKITLANLG